MNRSMILAGILRGLAVGLGTFALVSLASACLLGGANANLWWINASAIPAWCENALIAVGAASMLVWGIRPAMPDLRRRITIASVAILGSIAIANTINFYCLWAAGSIHLPVPLPVSLLVAGLLGAIVLMSIRPPLPQSRWPVMIGVIAFGVLFPLAQIALFGLTDYRRQADAILVLGARTYADGTPSQALRDRVRTGCDLYKQGYAARMIMSGGPGEGPIHETEAMAKMAADLGVPPDALIRDAAGINTAATMRNLQDLARAQSIQSVLAVSHAWHLPRVKLAGARGQVVVYTVPCKESQVLSATPLYVCREIVAFWKYWLTSLR